MEYHGRVLLGDDEGPIIRVNIDNPDHRRWEALPESADAVPGATKGEPILVTLLDGDRAGQRAHGELELTLGTSNVVLLGLAPFS